MKKSQVEKIDRLALLMVRQGKERSRALPAHAYRDPAAVYEFPAEIERQKALRKQKQLREREMLRRVRKDEVKVSVTVMPDGLNVCLECWKIYMSSDDRDLGASRMKLRGAEDNGRRDVHAEQLKADMRIGEATDAMIDSLRQLHRWAIFKKCGIASAWHFPSADFMSTLFDAEEDLRKKLKNNIATGQLFS